MTKLSEQRLSQLKAAAQKLLETGRSASLAQDLLALIATAETATVGEAPGKGLGNAPWRPTHRHLKSGGDYRVICTATLEADRSDAVVYDDKDGTVWVRSAMEFYDGRFAPLTQ